MRFQNLISHIIAIANSAPQFLVLHQLGFIPISPFYLVRHSYPTFGGLPCLLSIPNTGTEFLDGVQSKPPYTCKNPQGYNYVNKANCRIFRLPLGLAGFLMATTGPLAQKINSKWLILFGQVMSLAATILLPFSGPKNRYWSFVFPAFTIGSAGNMLSYVHTK